MPGMAAQELQPHHVTSSRTCARSQIDCRSGPAAPLFGLAHYATHSQHGPSTIEDSNGSNRHGETTRHRQPRPPSHQDVQTSARGALDPTGFLRYSTVQALLQAVPTSIHPRSAGLTSGTPWQLFCPVTSSGKPAIPGSKSCNGRHH